MITIQSVNQLNDEISKLLHQCGDIEFELDEIIEEARESLHEIREDAKEHGEEQNTPFFSYMVGEQTAIFFFFEEKFLIYIFRCNPESLINDIERDYALEDVSECKDYLKRKESKEPDLIMDFEIAQKWMGL